MLKIIPSVICSIALASTISLANDALKTQKQKTGYTLGVQLGSYYKDSKDQIDIEALKLGVQDIFNGSKVKISEDEMRKIFYTFQDTKKKLISEKVKKEGKVFQEANKKKKGVVTLASGLQYKVLKKGSGKVSPKLTDTVETHYEGTLIDGTVFDSSYKRGKTISFPVNGVIAGWTEALQLMKAGDKWQLVVPSELAYGEQGAGGTIKPGATLLFDVELISIKK
jgi:FKBP-type peptidyl-prolyl cis-trans isomerase